MREAKASSKSPILKDISQANRKQELVGHIPISG